MESMEKMIDFLKYIYNARAGYLDKADTYMIGLLVGSSFLAFAAYLDGDMTLYDWQTLGSLNLMVILLIVFFGAVEDYCE